MTLKAIRGGPGSVGAEWPTGSADEARAMLEDALENADHYVILAIERLPDNKTKHTFLRHSRGTRTSFLEMVGAVQSMLHDWLAGL